MSDGLEDPRLGRWQSRTVVTLIALGAVVLAALGGALVWHFVDGERQRDLRAWQVRLGIVADSRGAAVDDWLDRQLDAVQGLARNASLQLYATELALAGGNRAAVTEEAAQAGYLRNLLIVTADRTGFTGMPTGPQVAANVKRQGTAGLAVVDTQGRVLVATPDMPAVDARLRDFIAGTPSGPVALDMYADAAGRPSMAFFAPVSAVQGDPGSAPVAGVIGIKEVGGELFPLLSRSPVPEKSAETLLVRRVGPVIEFLSPTADGTAALGRRLAADTPALAEAFALATPGGFAIRRDYRDAEVLVTGRAIAHVPWTLVQKVDRAEALAESDARLNRLLVLLLLTVGLLAVGFIAAWRHGASRRANAAATRLQVLSRRLESQANLLRVVTDNQPAAIFIADDQECLRFVNRILAERAGVTAGDLVAKSLASAFGPADAARYRRLNREALERGAPQPSVHRVGSGGTSRIIHAEHIPLPATPGERPAVLVVEEDITAPILERERRERTLRQLVRSLVALLDRRDPFAADHSQRVAAVARRVAEEMGIDTVAIETADIAGNLMNIGKILVSPQLLTRSGNLSDDERQQIRHSLQAGADLLDGIEFDGPVVDTLRQAQEQWDGGGPNALRGDEIPVTARVIAVANAFVAMISPRAHRPGIGIDAAIATLLEQSGVAFDRRVVAALVNDLENRGGRERWAEFARPAR